MRQKPGLWLLFGVILFCLIYFTPQAIGGEGQYESDYTRYLLAFMLILISVTFVVILLFDILQKYDSPIRKSAQSNAWVKIGAATVLVVGLILAIFMPQWNDENSNIEAARYLWQHGLGEYFDNYSQINKWLGKHHPPLLVLIYGLWYKLTGFSLLAGRLFNLAFAAGALWITFKWLKVAADEAIAGLALLALVITPMWSFSSASALLDMPFTFAFMSAVYFFERYVREEKAGHAILAGLLASVTVMCRYNGLFLFPIWFVMLLVNPETRGLLFKKRTWLIVAVPVLPALPWLVLALTKGALFVQIKHLSSFLLVGIIRPGGWWYLSEVLLPLFPIMMGMHTLPLLLYGFSSSWSTRDPGLRRIVTGALTYMFLLAITLPSPRYLLPVVPMMAAVMSVALWRLAASGKGMAPVLGTNILCSLGVLFFYSWATAAKYIYVFY